MAQYAIDFYGKEKYGQPLYLAFDAGNMVAEQTGYSRLEVSWDNPAQTKDSKTLAGVKDWSRLRLVRSPYGVPDTVEDGVILLDVASGKQKSDEDPPGDPENLFLDYNVVDGRPYYYAVFVSSQLDTYVSWRTYQPGDMVIDNGVSYRCLKVNTKNLTPAAHVADGVWEVTDVTAPWIRAGYCVGLAVKDHRYTQRLYDLIPRPYKVSQVETTASFIPVNQQLMDFVSVFGFFFDVMKSENDRMLFMNDTQKCSDRQLGLIAYQLGLLDSLPTMAELRRLYMRDALMIQRDRGTPVAVKALSESMTGWGADVSDGYNILHDQDMAAFATPVYPVWDPDATYGTHISPTRYAPVVTYGGSLYRSIAGYIDYSAGQINPSWISAIPSGVVSEQYEPLAYPYHSVFQYEATNVGDGIRITFPAPPAESPAHYIFVTLMGDPDGCRVSVKWTNDTGSSSAVLTPQDTYREGRQQLSPVRLGPVNLSPTGNKLDVTFSSVSPLSTGKRILLNFFTLQHRDALPNRGQEPNVPGSTYWQPVTAGQLRDFDSEWNPGTDGYGNWNVAWRPTGSSTNAMYNDRFDGSTEYMWISVRGPDTGVWPSGTPKPPYPGNSLAVAVTGSAPKPSQLFMMGGGAIKTTGWAANTRYLTGQFVTYNPQQLPYEPVYRALVSSEDRKPDVNPRLWELTSRPKPDDNQSLPDPAQVHDQCIPLPVRPAWNSTSLYKKGDTVSLASNIYQCALPEVRSTAPSGDSTNNRSWRWLGLDVQKYTFTSHHHRSAGTTQVHNTIQWYDALGSSMGITRVDDPRQQLLDRFEFDGAIYPPSSNPTPTPPPVPAPWQMGVQIPWIRARGNFTTKNGLVYPTSWGQSTDLEKQAGRVLRFNRSWIYTTATTDETAYVTFVSPPQPIEGATMEHGLCFRYGGTSTQGRYFLASRERLTYTLITFDASGNVTAVDQQAPLATWTAFPYGSRMRVTIGTSRIQVHVRELGTYASGWKQLADVTNSTNNTEFGIGILERVQKT
jgi:hypothetical protein